MAGGESITVALFKPVWMNATKKVEQETFVCVCVCASKGHCVAPLPVGEEGAFCQSKAADSPLNKPF